ncbi:hypothetical protein WDL1P1_00391 (plasmid) [Variovorax sp. WDL1]|uniref:hypothetical protein n=1 Tax=Variovorax sp. WDL1 TaxID=207745 RepID=UPI0008399A80|nr:hypothetical protein [Variovorax sp. WDL1]PNG50341.1 hypothetical protein CHC06_05964 [Variovorax sp. B2]PNG51214.1 hypothetical protein CHC07_05870 [Variovorax sp. B4]VTU42937.1 hypothetical protein SRS16P1_00396 [Variovorax sp. SRS16]VTU42968.1 hypothetical protein E5P1_00394 [Variovorax sp. PBL-E5]VTU43571.1 hypothetical protein H6P1_00510 [Variovorax sp. PBL-H6]
MEDLVTKVTRVMPRRDGSEVKLVAQAYFGAGLHRSTGVDVYRRASPHQNWQLCSDQPHPDWRTLSVDAYCKQGRSEKLQAASLGEILAVAALIGKPLHSLPSGIELQ